MGSGRVDLAYKKVSKYEKTKVKIYGPGKYF